MIFIGQGADDDPFNTCLIIIKMIIMLSYMYM